jgi:hypothetical protein
VQKKHEKRERKIKSDTFFELFFAKIRCNTVKENEKTEIFFSISIMLKI